MSSFESANPYGGFGEQHPLGNSKEDGDKPNESKELLNTFTLDNITYLLEHVEDYENALEEKISEKTELPPETLSKCKELLKSFHEKAKKELQIATLVATLFAPTPAYSTVNEEVIETDSTTEQAETFEAKVDTCLQTLRERVMTDNKESGYVLFGRRGSLALISEFEGEEGSGTVEMPKDEMEDGENKIKSIEEEESTFFNKVGGFLTNKPLTRVELHNHPYEIMQEVLNLDDEQIERMKSGEIPPIVAPPGGYDMERMVALVYAHSGESVDMVGHMEEPSGTWKYDIDESNPKIKKFSKILIENNKESAEEYKKFLEENPAVDEYLTETRNQDEADSLASNEELFERFPEYIDFIISQEKKYSEQLIDELGEDYIEAVADMSLLQFDIWKESIAGNDVTELIEKFINAAEKSGFYVEYQGKNGTHIKPKPKTTD